MEIILLAALSAFVFYRLWTVLGTRTGEEKTRDWPTAAKVETNHVAESDNVIVLPNRKVRPSETSNGSTRAFDHALSQLKENDSTFDEETFLRGCSRAFEKIVVSYANADHTQLKKLLSKEVYSKFADAIDARQQNEQQMEALIDFVEAEIVDVKLTKASASITVQFKSEQMLATVNADGTSHDNPARLKANVTDIWTFKRTFSSTSSIWLLVKTESKHV